MLLAKVHGSKGPSRIFGGGRQWWDQIYPGVGAREEKLVASDGNEEYQELLFLEVPG